MEEKNKTKKPAKVHNATKVAFGTLEISVLLGLTCIFSVISGAFLGNKFSTKSEISEIPVELNEVVKNYNYIIENFYGEVDKETVIKGAIRGMVESLGDKYTSFLDQLESETFNIHLRGTFSGIGVEIINSDEGVMILNVIDNSPATEVGLEPGDIFLEISGADVTKKTSNEITNIIKEQHGKFNILIKRDNKPITKELYKGVITLKSVHSKLYEENNKKIGYLGIDLFAANTYDQFVTELQKLEQKNIDGLIIDVRSNTGGHLSSVQNMLSLFLDSTHIIYQTEDKEGIEKTYSSGTVTKKYPIVLLSDGQSASASELLMGALRDELGAKIVGTRSFGKGTVQELNTISSNDQYKLTTKKWLTPKGNTIDKVGLEPDVVIEQTNEYFENPIEENDVQLKEAIKLFFEP